MAINLSMIGCSNSSRDSLHPKTQQVIFEYKNDFIIMGRNDTMKIIGGKVYNRVQKESSELELVMSTDKDTIIQDVGELHLTRSIRKIRRGTIWDRMIRQQNSTCKDTLLFVSELSRMDPCQKDKEDLVSAFVYNKDYKILYFFRNEIVVYE